MSESAKTPGELSPLTKPVPNWIGAGLIGLILGAGGTLIVMKANAKSTEAPVETADGAPATPPTMGGGPMGGAMGGGMMGMGGGGGGGGGGGARVKRSLTALVGELDLLTRETLHVELTPEQTAKIADHLAKLDQAEKMTADEAQSQLEALEALLTPEQKAVTDSISLPFGRPGGGGPGPGPGPGGGGPAGGGVVPPPASAMGPGGPGGGAEDENPFHQDVNKKRLRDLLGRIRPAATEPAKSEPGATEPTDNK